MGSFYKDGKLYTGRVESEQTRSIVKEKSAAANVTVPAGTTWLTDYKETLTPNVGIFLNIDNNDPQLGKTRLYQYDSVGTYGKMDEIEDFSSTAANISTGKIITRGSRFKVGVTNSDTIDWTFGNLDIIHS